MSVKVLTYTDPRKLDRLDSLKEYADALHVCATRNMKEGVYERYQKKRSEPFIKAPVVSAAELIDILLGNWMSAQTKLAQYLELSRIIQDDEQMPDAFRSAFRRNQVEVLETIRLLEVAGVTPDLLDDGDVLLSEKERIFVDIWKRFSPRSVRILRRHLRQNWQAGLTASKDELMGRIIQKAYGKKDSVLQKIDHSVGFDRIVLHGFYFMTPEQQRVFLALKEMGAEIVFLNLYDARYPESFRFIGTFINRKHGWLDLEEWVVAQAPAGSRTIADRFLSDFEGERLDASGENVPDVIAFRDFYAFLREYAESTEAGKWQKTYLAPNAPTLNDRLQEYYPESVKEKRHFLSYPVGQFLFQLHQMWRDEEGLVLTEQALIECFSSGWLYDADRDRNARDYTKTLQQIMPFFDGCVTHEEWAERADHLAEIYDDVLGAFQTEGGDRFERMMASPFSAFSQFASPKEDVLETLTFMKKTIGLAQRLFGDGSKRISLKDHFARLRELLEAPNRFLENELQEQELSLIAQLKEMLQAEPDLESFHVSDISAAISLYLSGKLEKDDSENELIRPFIEIDGEVFKEHAITHVTGLDEDSLPYSEFQLPWPLSDRVFHDLAKRNVPLSFLVLRNDSVKEITRYLLYILLQFSERVELSWMVQFEDKKNLDMAIYLSQLGLKGKTYDVNESEVREDLESLRKPAGDRLDALLDFPVDALAEFKYCPRRFYYSYLASEAVTYRSDFMQKFQFGNLIKSVAALMPEMSYDEVKEHVFELFPNWNEFRRNKIADENFAYLKTTNHYRGSTRYGDNDYSNLRKMFQFQVGALIGKGSDNDSREVADAILQLYRQPEKEIPAMRAEFEEQMELAPMQMVATPGYKCRYCPHQDICPAAYLAVDDAERKRKSR